MDPQDELQKQIAARFAELPKSVQDAITSSNVQAKLRTLSDGHRLHLDQWQMFENEVMLAIIGFQKVEDLEKNIKAHVKVPDDVALQLAVDVNAVIFEPIRDALERTLEHPEAKEAILSGAETARGQILDSIHEETIAASSASVVQSATPPSPAPDVKVTRPSESTAYRPGEASHERKSITDDPYREPAA